MRFLCFPTSSGPDESSSPWWNNSTWSRSRKNLGTLYVCNVLSSEPLALVWRSPCLGSFNCLAFFFLFPYFIIFDKPKKEIKCEPFYLSPAKSNCWLPNRIPSMSCQHILFVSNYFPIPKSPDLRPRNVMELVLCSHNQPLTPHGDTYKAIFLLGYESTSGINKTQKAIGLELDLWLAQRRFHLCCR